MSQGLTVEGYTSNTIGILSFAVSVVTLLYTTSTSISGPATQLSKTKEWLEETKTLLDELRTYEGEEHEGADGVMYESLDRLECVYQECLERHRELQLNYLESSIWVRSAPAFTQLQTLLEGLVNSAQQVRKDALRKSAGTAKARRARRLQAAQAVVDSAVNMPIPLHLTDSYPMMPLPSPRVVQP